MYHSKSVTLSYRSCEPSDSIRWASVSRYAGDWDGRTAGRTGGAPVEGASWDKASEADGSATDSDLTRWERSCCRMGCRLCRLT